MLPMGHHTKEEVDEWLEDSNCNFKLNITDSFMNQFTNYSNYEIGKNINNWIKNNEKFELILNDKRILLDL